MTADTQPAANPNSRRTSVCVGCGSQILDQYIMHVAPDLKWHAGCLKCADCHQYLDESCTCFVKDGKTYCKRDYVRLFGIKCQRCGDSLSKGDFVMRAKNDSTYHIDCFRCSMCRKQLIPGDEYVHREDGIYCRADHAELVDKTYGSPGSPGQTNNVNNNNNNNNSSKVNNNNVNGVGGESGCTTPVGGKTEGGEKPERGSGRREEKKRTGTKEHKTTRVRTVLNEKQLHTLRTCYSANPRPDALMKEQLTEMTGLSPRVIRVWFQNKRCKDKKRSMMLKQMQSQQEKHGWKMRPHYFYCLSEEMSGDDEIEITHSAKAGGGLGRPLQGVPMVAGEPVRHEPPPGLAASAVEVQTYQPPWKALADFAMHGELDHPQPPFQQLIHSFDHMDHGMHGPGMGSSPPGEGMLNPYLPHHHPHHPHHPHHLMADDMSNSVESDFQATSSGLSSPISQ